ncbi:hypothetical protein BKA00_005134 [Actinomadura coerulea]|uniref:N,N-dimethylformamidase beta subunit-like C-terminal domain-containing protein n=1 Tax=Actinomadura coerulea TaxID=46159 RepID=A0A7X0L174_9ACTN|nr:N,N-dimethylformamidase beta subunit family domain-containing protein [Actinomadura coerulea]MBB6398220.1 hypothetical protein [Actinomadura coerulea]GGQ11259.1 hypothetical protein GCM10010187_29490 [Actinomadura coerulea]
MSLAYATDNDLHSDPALLGKARGLLTLGLGPEADVIARGGPTPPTLEIVGRSPISCGTGSAVPHASYYTTRSGAWVFATGTMRWVCVMRGRACGHGVNEAGSAFVTRVTDTLVRAMAAGPLGHGHPFRPNPKELAVAP